MPANDSNLTQSPTFLRAGNGYFLSFRVAAIGFTATSDKFKVSAASLDRVSVYPNRITVAAGDNICGPRGSAWDEIDQFPEPDSTSKFCFCVLNASRCARELRQENIDSIQFGVSLSFHGDN